MSHSSSRSTRHWRVPLVLAVTIGLAPGCLFNISSEDRKTDTSSGPTDTSPTETSPADTSADGAGDAVPDLEDTNASRDLGNRECQAAPIRRHSCHFKPNSTERVGVCARGVERGNRCLLLRQLVYQADETRCDNQDNDCDGEVDEGCDGDGDGYCKAARTTIEMPCACEKGDGDCDDGNADINPGTAEMPGNEVDENCDGRILCYKDADEDEFAVRTTVESSDTECKLADGEQTKRPPESEIDCNDDAGDVHPNADEFPGNQVDDNCDGEELCYVDRDGDGFRTSETQVSSDIDCTGPGEATSADDAGDCDDTDPKVNPSVAEDCETPYDDNCNGTPNEGC